MPTRSMFLQRCASLTFLGWTLVGIPRTTTAFTIPTVTTSTPSQVYSPITDTNSNGEKATTPGTVAFKQLSLPMNEFGVTVPVACWFPVSQTTTTNSFSTNGEAGTGMPSAVYEHRISVRRIGQLIAGWEFIPEFVSKNYKLFPTSMPGTVVDGRAMPFPAEASPIVLLAHGYLGSRFDLAHLAEALASLGFVCISAEYPESLAASYDRVEGLDRKTINQELLATIRNDWKLKSSAYGIIGHSLGCGTVQQTGDSSWTRVSIAGFPRNRDGTTTQGNGLLLVSTNDGLFSRYRLDGLETFTECRYELLTEAALPSRLPRRAAMVYDRPDAPNHISFLAEGVNEAMMDFLSPLLPVAQAFQLPVLDFDRYQTSRDSAATAAVVHPLIIQYMKQEMLKQ